MPQMAPISWLTLFVMFSLAFMMFSVVNYYSTIPQSPKSKISQMKSIKTLDWKW